MSGDLDPGVELKEAGASVLRLVFGFDVVLVVVVVGEPELLGDPLGVTLLEVALAKRPQLVPGLLFVPWVLRLGFLLEDAEGGTFPKDWRVLSGWRTLTSSYHKLGGQGGAFSF